jgi:hypothetical protein
MYQAQVSQPYFLAAILQRDPEEVERWLRSDWLFSHAERIRVYFLPGCSPELNPDELFNNDIKADLVGRTHPRTLRELIARVKHFTWGKGHNKPAVAAYFRERHVAYASAYAISPPGNVTVPLALHGKG